MSIAEQVRTVISEQLVVQPEEVIPGAVLHDDLGADSLDAIALVTAAAGGSRTICNLSVMAAASGSRTICNLSVMAIEERFGIEIPPEEAERLQRVRDVIQAVEAQAAEAMTQSRE